MNRSLTLLARERFSFSWLCNLTSDVYWAAKLEIIDSVKEYICRPEIDEIWKLIEIENYDVASHKIRYLEELISGASIIKTLEAQLRLKKFVSNYKKEEDTNV